MSKVACVNVDPKISSEEKIFAAVSKAIRLVDWERGFRKGNLVLKVNAVWDKIYPGCVTSPMVIEGVIKEVLSSKKFKPTKITIVDTDTAAIMHADNSFRVQGLWYFNKKYGVELVNLTNTNFREVTFKKGLVLRKMKISEVLLDADNIITMPIMKTHAYSTITGALKNQWGCIHDLRHNHHLVLSQAIADVNNYFHDKIHLAVMDALFGMEGNGPKLGDLKVVGQVLASHDLVALDAAAATIMGFNPDAVKHINFADKVGVGAKKFTIVGDKLPSLHFRPAKEGSLPMNVEMKLRHVGPRFEKVMFSGWSPFLFAFRWTGRIYNDGWYYVFGLRQARTMMKTNWGKIWQRRYLL